MIPSIENAKVSIEKTLTSRLSYLLVHHKPVCVLYVQYSICNVRCADSLSLCMCICMEEVQPSESNEVKKFHKTAQEITVHVLFMGCGLHDDPYYGKKSRKSIYKIVGCETTDLHSQLNHFPAWHWIGLYGKVTTEEERDKANDKNQIRPCCV